MRCNWRRIRVRVEGEKQLLRAMEPVVEDRGAVGLVAKEQVGQGIVVQVVVSAVLIRAKNVAPASGVPARIAAP